MPSHRAWEIDAILAVRTRGDVRAAGEWLDGPGRGTREALVARARSVGREVPEDWEELGGKRLVRALLGRSEAAQERSTPIALDEAFTCVACGREVPPGGRRPRDHCPWCLRSVHVDNVPGDRAAGCGGLLVPVAVLTAGGGSDLVYRCDRCGARKVNRVLDDVVPPDDREALYRVAEEAARLGRLS